MIYVATNLVDGKQYVSLTTTSLEERWFSHLEQVSRKTASLIHKAIAKFGEESFTLEVVGSAPCLQELQAKERQWIQRLNTLPPHCM